MKFTTLVSADFTKQLADFGVTPQFNDSVSVTEVMYPCTGSYSSAEI
jgi:hypothetical protein